MSSGKDRRNYSDDDDVQASKKRKRDHAVKSKAIIDDESEDDVEDEPRSSRGSVVSKASSVKGGKGTERRSSGSGASAGSGKRKRRSYVEEKREKQGAPVITNQLTDTEVSVGGSAMLELKVTGAPKPEVKWFKGKSQLEVGDRVRFLYENDESIALIIKNVNYADEGLYKVVATNDQGEASTQGNLIVRQPPKFLKKMQDMSMMAGEAFTIDVDVEGNPKPELKWYKDGVLIVSSERIKFVQSSDDTKYLLQIESVTLDDKGTYSVIASNPLGQMSEFWNVLATSPARFTERLPGQLIREKGDMGGEFILKTAGVPEPKVEVKVNGKELKVEELEPQVYKIVVGELTEARDYTVLATATNHVAKDETVCIMNVNRGVTIVDGLKDVVMKELGECTVGVKVDCFPKPNTIKWFMDGVEADDDAYVQKEEQPNTYTLTLKDCWKEDSCKLGVRVLMDNGLGEGESSGTITLQVPPVMENELAPVYRFEHGTTQVLNVVLQKTLPIPTGIWFHNRKEVNTDERVRMSNSSTRAYTLTFEALAYEDAGEWAFKAITDIDEVWTRTVVIVEGNPQFQLPLPQTLRIMETERYDFDVKILDYCEENVKIEWQADVETVFKPVIPMKRNGNEYVSKVTLMPNKKIRYFKVVATNKYGECESICEIDWIEVVPPRTEEEDGPCVRKPTHPTIITGLPKRTVTDEEESNISIPEPVAGPSRLRTVLPPCSPVPLYPDTNDLQSFGSPRSGSPEPDTDWASDGEVDDHNVAAKQMKDYDLPPGGPRSTKGGKKEKETNTTEPVSPKSYPVQKILDKREVDGEVQFLVRWSGCTSTEDTWEPEEHLTCDYLMIKYEMNQFETRILKEFGKLHRKVDKLQRTLDAKKIQEGESDGEEVHTPSLASPAPRKRRQSKTSTKAASSSVPQASFKCSLCVKTFADQAALRKHSLIHQGKRFQCTVCDHAPYTRKENLKAHVDSAHAKVDRKKYGKGENWYVKVIYVTELDASTADDSVQHNESEADE